MSDCDARIRPFRGVNETELGCGLDPEHDWSHEAVLRDYYAPGSEQVLVWDEGDRRTFRGVFAECPVLGCLLPDFHPGNHWDEP